MLGVIHSKLRKLFFASLLVIASYIVVLELRGVRPMDQGSAYLLRYYAGLMVI